MATPWWIVPQYNFDPEQGSYQTLVDSNTGRPVQQDASGRWMFTDTPATYDAAGTRQPGPTEYANYAAQALQAQVMGAGVGGQTNIRLPNGTVVGATPLQGDASDYARVFGGMVDGKGIAQTPGVEYKPQIVQGSDGNYYAAHTPGAQVTHARPDNSSLLGSAWSSFGPIITAMAGAGAFTGGESLASMLGGGPVGQAGASAITSGANTILGGGGVGDAIKNAALGAVRGGVGSEAGSIATGAGLPDPIAKLAGNVAGNVATGRDLGQSVAAALPGAAINTLAQSIDSTGGKTMDENTSGWDTANDYNNYSDYTTYPDPTFISTGDSTQAGGAGATPSIFGQFLSNLNGNDVLKGLGITSAGLGVLSGLNSLMGGSLFGKAPQTPQDAAKRADPFAAYRDQYAQQLNALMSNPSLTMSRPGYQFQLDQGLQTIQRQGARQGMSVPGVTPQGNQVGAGQLGISLMNYGQDYAAKSFNDDVNRLMALSGATVSPTAGQQAFSQAQGPMLQQQQLGVQGIQQGLGALSNIFGTQAPRGYGNVSSAETDGYVAAGWL